ncbi:hypothetical protein J6590_027405 [Homalodisca vitripennis]|nr:hypothetical protein J6590_027405 [Homalodisca vitripennis]
MELPISVSIIKSLKYPYFQQSFETPLLTLHQQQYVSLGDIDLAWERTGGSRVMKGIQSSLDSLKIIACKEALLHQPNWGKIPEAETSNDHDIIRQQCPDIKFPVGTHYTVFWETQSHSNDRYWEPIQGCHFYHQTLQEDTRLPSKRRRHMAGSFTRCNKITITIKDSPRSGNPQQEDTRLEVLLNVTELLQQYIRKLAQKHVSPQRPLILQKKCIRILAGLQPRDTCREAFIELHILTVVSLYILQVIMYANNNNLTRGRDLHTYNTYRAANFTLPAHRTALYSEKPSYMGAKLFNILPEFIKSQEESNAIKRELRRWLLNYPFYTIDEFLNWRIQWNFET